MTTPNKQKSSRKKSTRSLTGGADIPLPQSIAAEAALLGSILFEPLVMPGVDEIVKPADFYVPANQAVAQALWQRWENNQPIDAALIYEDLVRRKQDEMIGGHEGLMRLADSVPESSHAEHYARIVSDKAQLRILIDAAQQVLMMSMTATEETTEVLSRAESVMGKALQQRIVKGAVKFTEQFPKELNILTALDGFAVIAPGASTGFADLDDLITGFHPGELVIIAGRPSMGKTSFALKTALHMALENEKAVLIFSLETSVSQITRNLMSIHTQTSAHKMRSLSLSKQEKVQLAIRSARLIDCNITIDERADTLNSVRAACRHFALKNPLGLVIIDYLQLLGQEIKYKREELEQISRNLKRLASELAVPFLVVSQLSRAVEHRGQKVTKKSATKYFRAGETIYMPRLSDLRECIVGGTQIKCVDEKCRTIEDIFKNKKNLPEILVFDLENNKVTYQKPAAVIDTGLKKCIKLTTKKGKTITLSIDTPVLTDEGWVLAKNIKKTHSIYIDESASSLYNEVEHQGGC